MIDRVLQDTKNFAAKYQWNKLPEITETIITEITIFHFKTSCVYSLP